MLSQPERMVQEKKDLDEKIGKLGVFLRGEGRKSLRRHEHGKLVRQHRELEEYSSILGERISQFMVEC